MSGDKLELKAVKAKKSKPSSGKFSTFYQGFLGGFFAAYALAWFLQFILDVPLVSNGFLGLAVSVLIPIGLGVLTGSWQLYKTTKAEKLQQQLSEKKEHLQKMHKILVKKKESTLSQNNQQQLEESLEAIQALSPELKSSPSAAKNIFEALNQLGLSPFHAAPLVFIILAINTFWQKDIIVKYPNLKWVSTGGTVALAIVKVLAEFYQFRKTHEQLTGHHDSFTQKVEEFCIAYLKRFEQKPKLGKKDTQQMFKGLVVSSSVTPSTSGFVNKPPKENTFATTALQFLNRRNSYFWQNHRLNHNKRVDDDTLINLENGEDAPLLNSGV